MAVIRVSGPQAGAALAALTGAALPAPRRAARAKLRHPQSRAALDDALVLWFPGPASFTGEDVAELQIHGGAAVLAAIMAALGAVAGMRLAEPGEFTRRAFDAGKLDLAEVEGLADLIAAETEAQRIQALRQLDGELGRLVEAWRTRLLRALAHAEAEIDFPDEDLPGGLVVALAGELDALLTALRAMLDDQRRGEILRAGLSVAIVGPPNAGKSSLLNFLSQRDAAIVSAIAGTTRDIVETRLDIDGYPAIVADTAGLRDLADAGDAHSEIEREGAHRALARAAAADLKILVLDATRATVDVQIARLADDRTLVIANKIDAASRAPSLPPHTVLPVSVRTGAGMDGFMAALRERVAGLLARADSSAPLVTRARHRAALEECAAALLRARQGRDAELVAEDLRLATRALGRVAGRVGVEDVLDVIFREFCIGK